MSYPVSRNLLCFGRRLKLNGSVLHDTSSRSNISNRPNPSFILPRDAGEDREPALSSSKGGGLNGLNDLNDLNDLNQGPPLTGRLSID